MQAARGDRGDAGAGAVAVEHHADAEERRAERDAEHVGGLDVVARVAGLMQREHADAADDHGGEHDFQDGEILQPKLIHDDVVSRHAAAMQQHAEDDAERNGEPAQGFTGDG